MTVALAPDDIVRTHADAEHNSREPLLVLDAELRVVAASHSFYDKFHTDAPGTEGNISADQAKKIMGSWKTKQTALVLDPEPIISCACRRGDRFGSDGGSIRTSERHCGEIECWSCRGSANLVREGAGCAAGGGLGRSRS